MNPHKNQWFIESLIQWILCRFIYKMNLWFIFDESMILMNQGILIQMNHGFIDSKNQWIMESWFMESWILDSMNQWFIFDESWFIWICDSWNLRFLESMILGIMDSCESHESMIHGIMQRCCFAATLLPSRWVVGGTTSTEVESEGEPARHQPARWGAGRLLLQAAVWGIILWGGTPTICILWGFPPTI